VLLFIATDPNNRTDEGQSEGQTGAREVKAMLSNDLGVYAGYPASHDRL